MGGRKLSELPPSDEQVSTEDLLYIVDVSAEQSKKMTLGMFLDIVNGRTKLAGPQPAKRKAEKKPKPIEPATFARRKVDMS